MCELNRYRRYQKTLTLSDVFPSKKNLCACGCGKKLPKNRKKWASDRCRSIAVERFFIIKGDSRIIRNKLFSEEKGICQICFNFDIEWEADHIMPVYCGGGGLGIDNYQTLCKECHKFKSSLYQSSRHHILIS